MSWPNRSERSFDAFEEKKTGAPCLARRVLFSRHPFTPPPLHPVTPITPTPLHHVTPSPLTTRHLFAPFTPFPRHRFEPFTPSSSVPGLAVAALQIILRVVVGFSPLFLADQTALDFRTP